MTEKLENPAPNYLELFNHSAENGKDAEDM